MKGSRQFWVLSHSAPHPKLTFSWLFIILYSSTLVLKIFVPLHKKIPGAWSSLIRDSRHRKAATCQKSTQTAYHTLRITPITCLKLCTTPTAFKVSQNGKIPARIRRLRIIWFWRACYQVLLHWNCLQNAQLLQHCHLFLRWHLTKCMISYKAAQGNIFQNIGISTSHRSLEHSMLNKKK